MQKKPRIDKQKNKAKVAESIINNPHKTDREMAKELGIGKSSVNRAKQELGQDGTKDPVINVIVNDAKDRIERVGKLFNRYIDQIEEKEKLDNKDIQLAKDIVKDDQSRVMMLGGQLTDKEGGLNQPIVFTRLE